MKIYIASKYREYEINHKVYDCLLQNGFLPFLPETINKKETSLEEAKKIRDICANEIKQSDVLLVIDTKEAYGSDVGWEVGYAYALKTELNYPIEIVNLKISADVQCIRAMNDPCFSHVSDSIDKIIDYLSKSSL